MDTPIITSIYLVPAASCNVTMNNTYIIVWDSGASMCITNNKSDFIGPIQIISNSKVHNRSSCLQLEGVGTVCCSMLDTMGFTCHIKLPAYCISKACKQLLTSTSTSF